MTHTPKFSQVQPGEATENSGDEETIIGDQDQTLNERTLGNLDENMGAKSYSLDTAEDEPSDFMRGEIDVKTQMDRAAREMDAAIRGRRGPDRDPKPYR
jgi:hypothetical protein